MYICKLKFYHPIDDIANMLKQLLSEFIQKINYKGLLAYSSDCVIIIKKRDLTALRLTTDYLSFHCVKRLLTSLNCELYSYQFLLFEDFSEENK